MKKNIAYYLEDPKRLSEISLHELNKWVEEMPYSQPLRLLVDKKREKFVSTANEDNTSYGTYFAGDYEPVTKKAAKSLAKLNINKIKKEDRLVPNESIVEDDSVVEEQTDTAVEKEEIEIIEPPIIEHDLVDDVSEDILEEDLLETNPNVVLVNEVSHETADEVLEDELENEVLELLLDSEEEETTISEIDSDLELNKAEEEIEADRSLGLVDYKSYVVGVTEGEIKEEVTGIEEIDLDKDSETEIRENQDEELVDNSKTASLDIIKGVSKKSKKKKKDKKKKTSEVDKKKKASKKKGKREEEKKKKKSKDKNSEKVKAKSKKKDKSKKSKSSKKKISSIKKVKGEILMTDSATGSKSVKGKAKKIKKEVKYVVVNEATTNDFKLKDYDGVSNFTNWLLEQKSINGGHEIEKKKTEVLASKKKDKKKKKRKKNKVLKVAQDSIKKSEIIISEPLANIMAAQGHVKKARKMYKQLSLIFPEKSGYFAVKIENLKKK